MCFIFVTIITIISQSPTRSEPSYFSHYDLTMCFALFFSQTGPTTTLVQPPTPTTPPLPPPLSPVESPCTPTTAEPPDTSNPVPMPFLVVPENTAPIPKLWQIVPAKFIELKPHQSLTLTRDEQLPEMLGKDSETSLSDRSVESDDEGTTKCIDESPTDSISLCNKS